jgi:hypothetical protein
MAKVKVEVSRRPVSTDSTVTRYPSGRNPEESKVKDQVFRGVPVITVTVPDAPEKPASWVFSAGEKEAEVTSICSVSPAARLVVPVMVM